METYLDLSELVASPLRTGIQRIEREVIRHWPGPSPLVPCRIDDEGRVLRLPKLVLDVLCAEDDGTPAARDAEHRALSALAGATEPVTDRDLNRVLNLELFYVPARADAYLRMAASGVRIIWYVYDFIPFLRPDLFAPRTTRHCMHFLRGLRAASRVGFLSEQTRQDYLTRIKRRPSQGDDGPVFLPGADGLRLERQQFSSGRRDFVAIGTVEPRKNSDALLAAFESLWNRGVNVRLIVAGRILPDAVTSLEFFARHAGNPRLMVMEQPSDATLREILRHARAVVMPSEVEGFGLPPYEAVGAGIPAIASIRLPSVALLPGGVMRLDRMLPATIADAVASLLADDMAERLWAEAADIQLPSWAASCHALSSWAQAS